MPKFRIPPDLQIWIDTRKRHRLSHVVIQMARELDMNPKKLGGLNNRYQEPWKAPLPEFMADLYLRRFGRSHPETVMTIEEIARRKWGKEAGATGTASRRTNNSRKPRGATVLKQEGGRPIVLARTRWMSSVHSQQHPTLADESR